MLLLLLLLLKSFQRKVQHCEPWARMVRLLILLQTKWEKKLLLRIHTMPWWFSIIWILYQYFYAICDMRTYFYLPLWCCCCFFHQQSHNIRSIFNQTETVRTGCINGMLRQLQIKKRQKWGVKMFRSPVESFLCQQSFGGRKLIVSFVICNDSVAFQWIVGSIRWDCIICTRRHTNTLFTNTWYNR